MTIETYAVTTFRNKVEYDAISLFGIRLKEGVEKRIRIGGIDKITAAFIEQVYTANKYRSLVHINIEDDCITLNAPEPQIGEKGSIATFNLIVIAKVLNRDKVEAHEVVFGNDSEEQLDLFE
jgi:monoamine oxidase